MKTGKFIFYLSLVYLSACNSQPESSIAANGIGEAVHGPLKSNRQATPEHKERVVRSIEEKLAALSSELEGLKARAAILNGDLKSDLVGALHTLENRAKNLQNRLVELRRAAADQWELMREEMSAAMKDLEEASRYFADRVPA